MAESGRSRGARVLAETALVRVLWNLRDSQIRPIVLGGLVPDVLVAGVEPPPPAHVGTNDVDLFVELGVFGDDTTTLTLIEDALRSAGFLPDAPVGGAWRWRGEVDGALVKVELLSQRTDGVNEAVTLSPSGQLGVFNLRGTGYVARDHERHALTGHLPDGSEVSIEIEFAGLQGYLLAKLCAARARGLDRDFYDLVYVLLHNRLGGPAAAGHAIREGAFRDDLPSLRSTLREIRERFRSASDAGPTGYATEARQTEIVASEADLRADAVGAVIAFLDAIEAHRV